VRHPAAAYQRGAVEDVAEIEDAGDPGPFEGGVVDRVLRGHRAGVRGGDRGRRREAPGLEGEDRLGAGEGACGGHERPRPADRLDVEQDRAGLLVLAEVVDEIAEADVEGVAERDEVGEADTLVARPVEHRGAERSGLREEGDLAVARHRGAEAGVEVAARDDHPEAVRPEDPHPGEAGVRGAHLLFERPPRLARLAKAGGHHDQAEDPGLAAGGDGGRHLFGRGADDRELGHPRQARDVGEAGDPEHRLLGRMDGVDDAGKAAGDEVREHLAADAVRVGRGAHEGDPLRIEDPAEVVDAHGASGHSAGGGARSRAAARRGRSAVAEPCRKRSVRGSV